MFPFFLVSSFFLSDFFLVYFIANDFSPAFLVLVNVLLT